MAVINVRQRRRWTKLLADIVLFVLLLLADDTLCFTTSPQKVTALQRRRTNPAISLVWSALSSSEQQTHQQQPEEQEVASASAAESSSHFLSSFDDLGLDPAVRDAVPQHWGQPTPIQQLAIPQLLDNDKSISVWCEAPTGAGKTAAYALPLLQRQMQQRTPSSSDGATISALVLCPTRELVTQTSGVLRQLSSQISASTNGNKKKKGWKIVSLYGGVQREPQIAELAAAVQADETIDVVVATPGRLVDVLQYYNTSSSAADDALEQRLLAALDDDDGGNRLSLTQIQQGKLDRDDDEGRARLASLLDNVDYLVLDEADRLLGRGFESEMESVLDLLLSRRQQESKSRLHTWLFSATFPKALEPRVDQVVRRIHGDSGDDDNAVTTNTVRISCSNSDRRSDDTFVSASLSKKLQRVQNTTTTIIEQVGPASTIDLRAIRLEKRDRTQALRYLLEENANNNNEEDGWDRVLVFVASRYAAEHVSRKLRRVGIRSAELHGKLDQAARERRLQDLQTGKIRVLIATDVASRGLDIVGLPVVVNYDLPRSTADFVHRVGRTGRAGRRGTAVTFCTPDSEEHFSLIEERHLPERLERTMLPGFEVDEEKWRVETEGSRWTVPGAQPSEKGLAHDRMFGGIKGRRKSKKDKLREKAALEAARKANASNV